MLLHETQKPERGSYGSERSPYHSICISLIHFLQTTERTEKFRLSLCPTQMTSLSDDSLLPTMGSISTNSKLRIMIT